MFLLMHLITGKYWRPGVCEQGDHAAEKAKIATKAKEPRAMGGWHTQELPKQKMRGKGLPTYRTITQFE
jgi:hypothetical protein